jgi:hypothetical protein
MAGPRDRGRALSRGEIVQRHALLDDDGEPVTCSTCSRTNKPKPTYPTFSEARDAANQLVQGGNVGTELHLHPCQVDPTHWHHTSKPPVGNPDAVTHRRDGVTWPPRRKWTVRRVQHPSFSGVAGLSHKIGDHLPGDRVKGEEK